VDTIPSKRIGVVLHAQLEAIRNIRTGTTNQRMLTLFSTPRGFGYQNMNERFGSFDVLVVRGWNGLMDSSNTILTAVASFS
jgi:hypothetical protein